LECDETCGGVQYEHDECTYYEYNDDAFAGRPGTFYTKGTEIMTHFLTDILHNTR